MRVNIAAMLMSQAASPMSEATASESKETKDALGKAVENILGKDAFLNLLMTQLRYQNPLEPVKDQDFIAQMAQFSALEQMQNLSRTMELFLLEERLTNLMAQATALLGRKVEVNDGTNAATGTVEAIKIVDGIPHVVIDGSEYKVTDVVKVLTG